MAQTNSFFVNLEHFFVTKFHELEAVAVNFLPKLEHAVEVAFEDLAALAGKAILAEAPKLISGSEKFGNAVANVVQTVEAGGKTVLINTAQAAVQTAFLAAQDFVSNIKK